MVLPVRASLTMTSEIQGGAPSVPAGADTASFAIVLAALLGLLGEQGSSEGTVQQLASQNPTTDREKQEKREPDADAALVPALPASVPSLTGLGALGPQPVATGGVMEAAPGDTGEAAGPAGDIGTSAESGRMLVATGGVVAEAATDGSTKVIASAIRATRGSPGRQVTSGEAWSGDPGFGAGVFIGDSAEVAIGSEQKGRAPLGEAAPQARSGSSSSGSEGRNSIPVAGLSVERPTVASSENGLVRAAVTLERPEGSVVALDSAGESIGRSEGHRPTRAIEQRSSERVEGTVLVPGNASVAGQQLQRREEPTSTVVQQVGDRLASELARGVRHVRVRLEPPDLGVVDVRVREIGGKLEITLAASQGEVRTLLEQGRDGLRQALATNGHVVQRVEVQPLQATGDARWSLGDAGGGAGSSGHAWSGTGGGQRQEPRWSGPLSEVPLTGTSDHRRDGSRLVDTWA